jgi:hypothetical protein
MPRTPSLKRALILAALLVVFDGFFLNQGIYTALVAAWLLLVSLPRTLLPRFAGMRAARLRNIGIYALAVALVFVLIGAQNRLASRRAGALVAAVHAFHERHQRYPKSLQELAPDFIEHVPRAKYAVTSGDFIYAPSRDRDDALLMYVVLPPFRRAVYSFARREWGTLD